MALNCNKDFTWTFLRNPGTHASESVGPANPVCAKAYVCNHRRLEHPSIHPFIHPYPVLDKVSHYMGLAAPDYVEYQLSMHLCQWLPGHKYWHQSSHI